MENEKRSEVHIERVDDLPVLFGLLQQMNIQEILDDVIRPHGNWQGLTPGWVITMWLMHILGEQNHCMEPVQEWVKQHLVTLERLSGQEIKALDFSDDRLALCLKELAKTKVWHTIEERLGTILVRVDATGGSVGHDAAEHTLFKVGKVKNGSYETQFKSIFSIFRGERGLSLSKAVGFDRLNQLCRDLLRRYIQDDVSQFGSTRIAGSGRYRARECG